MSRMSIKRLEEQYRLRTKLDECGDKIIPGRRGHLYLDDGKLCLMAVDTRVRVRSAWEALGGKLQLGDISRPENGRRVQDVLISGIPEENLRAAMKLAGVFARRIPTPEQVAQLARIRPTPGKRA